MRLLYGLRRRGVATATAIPTKQTGVPCGSHAFQPELLLENTTEAISISRKKGSASSQDLLQKFNRKGFVVVRDFLSDEQNAALLGAVTQIESTSVTNGADPGSASYLHFYEEDKSNRKRIARTEYIINFSTVVNDLLTGLTTSNAFPVRDIRTNTLDAVQKDCVLQADTHVATIRDLVSVCNGGYLMNLYKEKINYKYPYTGSFRPHQDITAYPNSVRHITCLLSLCDTSVQNGCLHFPSRFSSSDRFQIFPHDKGAMTDTDEIEWMPVPTKFGDVVLFDSYVPHKSPQNQTDHARMALYATFNDASEGDIREEYYALKKTGTRSGAFSLINHYDAKFCTEEKAASTISSNDLDLDVSEEASSITRKNYDAKRWEEVWEMFEGNIGNTLYDPFCTQVEHAFQTAQIARKNGADERMQLACFLHDIGHLVLDEHDGMPDKHGHGSFLAKDLKHETVGFQYLRELGLGKDVLVPVCLHVRAKRYLCSVDTAYWDGLSDNSKRSLELQGGKLTQEQVESFERNPYAMDAAKLRRWEDEGKNYYNHQVSGGRQADCQRFGETFLEMEHVKQWVQNYFQAAL